MNDGVNIPIKVTGADQARQEISGVRESIGDAAKKNADAQHAANEETKKAGELFGETHRKGERLVKEVFAAANPELAHLTELLFNVNEGLLKITGTMAALAAGGAAIAIVVESFKKLADNIERSTKAHEQLIEAQDRQRDKHLAFIDKALAAGRPAGVIDVPGAISAANELGPGGILAEDAIRAAVAGGVAKRLGVPFDRERWLRGAAVTADSPSFGADEGENRKTLARILSAGDRPDSVEALAALRVANRERAAREALPEESPDAVQLRIKTLLDRIDESGQFSAEQFQNIRTFARGTGGVPGSALAAFKALKPDTGLLGILRMFSGSGPADLAEHVPELASQMAAAGDAQAQASQAANEGGPIPPVIIFAPQGPTRNVNTEHNYFGVTKSVDFEFGGYPGK